MNLKERIGNNISIYRKEAHLKQSELAEKVGVSTKHQSRIETGVHFPSAELLENYAKILNIDISDLLNIKDIDSSENLLENIYKLLDCANEEQIKILYKFARCIIK